MKTLRDWLPREWDQDFNAVANLTRHLDQPIAVEMSSLSNMGTFYRWPGTHKNVGAWVILKNGITVGWNESPSRGWGFPSMKLVLHELYIVVIDALSEPRYTVEDGGVWGKTTPRMEEATRYNFAQATRKTVEIGGTAEIMKVPGVRPVYAKTMRAVAPDSLSFTATTWEEAATVTTT